MSLLPKKSTPQEWTDVVLPLFDQPEEVEPRARSKKQDDDDSKVAYRRLSRTSKGVGCQDCAEGSQAGSGLGIVNASYIRHQGGEQRALCYRHKSDWQNREMLSRDG